MLRDAETDATIEALEGLAAAGADVLGRLRDTSDPGERAALGAAFEARVDDLRAGLRRRHGLTDRQAAAILARALARISETARAAGVG